MDTCITRAEHEEFCRRMEDEHNRQRKRIERLEANMRETTSIAASVEKLATNMEAMLKEQEKQGERLDTLERQPAQNWYTVTRTILTTVVSTLTGGVIGALTALLVK